MMLLLLKTNLIPSQKDNKYFIKSLLRINIIDARNYKMFFFFFIESWFANYSISDAINSLIAAINVRPEEKELFVQQEVSVHEEQGRQVWGWLRSGTWVSRLFFSFPSLLHVLCMFSGPQLLCFTCFSRHMYPPILISYIYIYNAIFNRRAVKLFLISFGPRLHNRWVEFFLMILCEIELFEIIIQDILEKNISLSFTE